MHVRTYVPKLPTYVQNLKLSKVISLGGKSLTNYVYDAFRV